VLVQERKRRLARVASLVRERGREKLGRVAWEAGWSYKYLRYTVLPEILAITECIEYDKGSDELVWVCEEEGVA